MMSLRISVTSVAALLAAAFSAHAGTIPITVEEPSGVDRQSWPVTSGIPFAQGILTAVDQVALMTDSGKGWRWANQNQ